MITEIFVSSLFTFLINDFKNAQNNIKENFFHLKNRFLFLISSNPFFKLFYFGI